MDKYTKRIQQRSIFNGKEDWREDEGFKQGLKTEDLKSNAETHRSPAFKKGYQKGIDKQKYNKMRDLITGDNKKEV